jgi:predicted RNA-binding protein with PIN domain
MSYLIDGNNVMGQRVGWHKDKPGARRRLLSELALFARKNDVTIDVVFDGAADEFFPDGSLFMGVRVFYARRGSNADERIKQFVESSRERHTLKVVTSDRELGAYVRRCGAGVLSSGQFRRRLDEIRDEAETAIARRRDDEATEESTEEWMRYFGVADDDEE